MKIQHYLSGQMLSGSRPNRFFLDAFSNTSFTKHNNLNEGVGKKCHDSKIGTAHRFESFAAMRKRMPIFN